MASGSAINQLLSTHRILRRVFDSTTPDLLLTPSRREIIREHLYRELSKGSYDSDPSVDGQNVRADFSMRVRRLISAARWSMFNLGLLPPALKPLVRSMPMRVMAPPSLCLFGT